MCLAVLPDARHAIFVPGRIEVLGKHTDYCGGQSIVCATEQGFVLTVRNRTDSRVRLIDVEKHREVEFALAPDLRPTVGDWTNYPMTLARRVARNFPGKLVGADIAFASNLPQAAGLSSSSAFIVVCFMALDAVNRLTPAMNWTAEQLAGYLGCVENGQTYGSLAGDRGVGTFGGSQDHTAILCSSANLLSVFAYCPVAPVGTVEFPDDWVFVIGSSGVLAEKTGSALDKYNRVSTRAADVVAAARKHSPVNTLADVVKLPRATIDAINRDLSEDLLSRVYQFVMESELVRTFSSLLQSRQFSQLGQCVDRSHELARAHLLNQTDQTNHLQRAAREFGAIAASAFGAGFGGSVWAIVRSSAAQEFLDRWQADYASRFPEESSRSAFFTTRPSSPARVIEL